MRHPFLWGFVAGAAALWLLHAVMPGQHAIGAPSPG
jgi:hypothetical protein